MSTPLKQHLIDPEICIRCYTCEMTCPIQAIEHDDNNVVVDESKCDHCLNCIPVCPTGSIDEWRVVNKPYTLEEQYGWDELPEQQELQDEGSDSETQNGDGSEVVDTTDEAVAKLLAEAHRGAGGVSKAPLSASKPTVNLYNLSNPIEAVVQGNYRLTDRSSDDDVRHVVLDFQGQLFPVLEGQSIGIIAPGTDANGKKHLPRLYSVSSPRDGERAGYNNVSLTVKREPDGLCSSYLCDLVKGDSVKVIGPFGSTFLMPNNPEAKMLMICTGTGSAPMRAFTMARQRNFGDTQGGMVMFFGARTPDSLPYHGPLKKIPNSLLEKQLVFSRLPNQEREYVQHRMRREKATVLRLLLDNNTHIYICGLKEMENGVEQAFNDIADNAGYDWSAIKSSMREQGRYHVETY